MIILESDTKKLSRTDLKKFWENKEPEWHEKRQIEWHIIELNNLDKVEDKEKKLLENYFLKGEVDGYLSFTYAYAFTPFETPVDAYTVFSSELLDFEKKRMVAKSFPYIAAKVLAGISWKRAHINNFISGVWGSTYSPIFSKVNEKKQEVILDENSDMWLSAFFSDARKYLLGTDFYSGCLDCFDYFITSIPHLKPTKFFNKRSAEQLFKILDLILLIGTDCAEKYEFAKKLDANKKLVERALEQKY
ncbi:hypothetical protein [Pleionea sediminis]|uniref:hypothetical protein n=1 Tax=Pleionea sediminis TaxID=2569479 RepID=UPI0011866188|nr:hypothetical protein [Pleionea sediminis]